MKYTKKQIRFVETEMRNEADEEESKKDINKSIPPEERKKERERGENKNTETAKQKRSIEFIVEWKERSEKRQAIEKWNQINFK